jgi:hypothetical protein
MLLDTFHTVIVILMMIGSFIPDIKMKKISYYLILTAFITWVVFDSCILWDIQKKFDKNLDESKDTIGVRWLGISNDKWAYINAILVYTNFLVLGYQLGTFKETLAIFMIYLCFNGQFVTRPMGKFLHPQD